jgi:hypothetical protein
LQPGVFRVVGIDQFFRVLIHPNARGEVGKEECQKPDSDQDGHSCFEHKPGQPCQR